MFPAYDRRSFLAASTAFGFLKSLPPVSAADAAMNPKLVAFEPEIEPLVRVLEDTGRDKVLKEIGNRIRKDTLIGMYSQRSSWRGSGMSSRGRSASCSTRYWW